MYYYFQFVSAMLKMWERSCYTLLHNSSLKNIHSYYICQRYVHVT